VKQPDFNFRAVNSQPKGALQIHASTRIIHIKIVRLLHILSHFLQHLISGKHYSSLSLPSGLAAVQSLIRRRASI